jgi:hypothetical protein
MRPDLDPGAVHLEGVAQAVFHLALVLGRGHVDEVDDDQAAQVAQAQLAGDFIGRLQVGVQRGFLDIAALGGAAELMSMETRASVWSMTMAPPEGRVTSRWKADSIWLSIW